MSTFDFYDSQRAKSIEVKTLFFGGCLLDIGLQLHQDLDLLQILQCTEVTGHKIDPSNSTCILRVNITSSYAKKLRTLNMLAFLVRPFSRQKG